MLKPKACVIKPTEAIEYECYDLPRKVTPLITADSCGAEKLSAGLYKLKPGNISKNDIHSEEEMYYVVSGKARLVMDDKSFLVESGMVVFIPANCWHQSTNIGDGELCYLWVFAPPPSGPQMHIVENWVRHEPVKR